MIRRAQEGSSLPRQILNSGSVGRDRSV